MEGDEASGRVIHVSGGRSLSKYPLDPSLPALTQDQVEAAAQLQVARGEFPPGDWRPLSAESAYFADALGEGGLRHIGPGGRSDSIVTRTSTFTNWSGQRHLEL